MSVVVVNPESPPPAESSATGEQPSSEAAVADSSQVEVGTQLGRLAGLVEQLSATMSAALEESRAARAEVSAAAPAIAELTGMLDRCGAMLADYQEEVSEVSEESKTEEPVTVVPVPPSAGEGGPGNTPSLTSAAPEKVNPSGRRPLLLRVLLGK